MMRDGGWGIQQSRGLIVLRISHSSTWTHDHVDLPVEGLHMFGEVHKLV